LAQHAGLFPLQVPVWLEHGLLVAPRVVAYAFAAKLLLHLQSSFAPVPRLPEYVKE
jgi:hypothetical protein